MKISVEKKKAEANVLNHHIRQRLEVGCSRWENIAESGALYESIIANFFMLHQRCHILMEQKNGKIGKVSM